MMLCFNCLRGHDSAFPCGALRGQECAFPCGFTKKVPFLFNCLWSQDTAFPCASTAFSAKFTDVSSASNPMPKFYTQCSITTSNAHTTRGERPCVFEPLVLRTLSSSNSAWYRESHRRCRPAPPLPQSVSLSPRIAALALREYIRHDRPCQAMLYCTLQ